MHVQRKFALQSVYLHFIPSKFSSYLQIPLWKCSPKTMARPGLK